MHAYLHTLPLHASFLCPNNDIRLYIGKNVQSESLTTLGGKKCGLYLQYYTSQFIVEIFTLDAFHLSY